MLPIRAVGEHFTRLEIGLVGSSYFAGLMLGCLACPAIVARVGHIRAFAAFTAIVTITPLCHAIATAAGSLVGPARRSTGCALPGSSW